MNVAFSRLRRNEWASFCHGEVNTQMPTNWEQEFGLLWRFPCWAATPEEAAAVAGMDVSVAKDYDFSSFTNGGYRAYDDELNVPTSYTIWASAQVCSETLPHSTKFPHYQISLRTTATRIPLVSAREDELKLV